MLYSLSFYLYIYYIYNIYIYKPGGALPYKPIRDVPFFRVSFSSINSSTGYKN